MKETILKPASSWNAWSEEKKPPSRRASATPGGKNFGFENDEFTIWTIHLKPGASFNFHRHAKPYYWTALSAGKAISHRHDGPTWETEYEIGDAKYLKDLSEENFFIHDVLNAGDAPLTFSTAEFHRRFCPPDA